MKNKITRKTTKYEEPSSAFLPYFIGYFSVYFPYFFDWTLFNGHQNQFIDDGQTQNSNENSWKERNERS